MSEPKKYLLNPAFDYFLIYAPVILGLSLCLTSFIDPQYYSIIFMLDLWLLGYHHVIATYTRTAFSYVDFKEHIQLNTLLPILVVCGTLGLYKLWGFWSIATLYLYWQIYHYSRQSEGIYKALLGKSGFMQNYSSAARVSFYIPAILAILLFSYKNPSTFLFMPVKTLTFHDPALTAGIIFCLIWIFVDILKLAWSIIKNKNIELYEMYYLSHISIFCFAYGVIENLSIGWIAINIWHNLQYIAFVWLFNNRRFNGSISKNSPLLSTLSQTKNLPLYLITCLLLTYIFYTYFLGKVIIPSLEQIIPELDMITVSLTYMTVNFHHYIVDSKIWKLRSKKIATNLQLSVSAHSSI